MTTVASDKPDGIYLAQTEEERMNVFRMRYITYVLELDRYADQADADNEIFREDVDNNSRLIYMVRDGKIVGGMRHTWGGDGPFTDRHISQYQLQTFLEAMTPEQIIVGERFFVAAQCRGSDVLLKMFEWYMRFVNENRIQLVFGDCEPHLLNLYMGLGFRPYSKTNFNSPDVGYLILLVIVAEDIQYLQDIKSPISNVLKDYGSERQIPDVIKPLISTSGIHSQKYSHSEAYWSEIFGELERVSPSISDPFTGLSDEQKQKCLQKSSIIECNAEDVLILKGNTANHMYMVIEGVVEVRGDDDQVLALFTPGDLFGEMAFLLGLPRTQNVYATTDGVKVLALSEAQIRAIMKDDPDIAAALLLNISRMLCMRLLKSASGS